jgi:hypothetical protein
MRMSWKLKVSLILLLAAIVYVFMAPNDFLPFTFFDNLGFIVVAVIIWILVVVVVGVKFYEKNPIVVTRKKRARYRWFEYLYNEMKNREQRK